MVLHPSRPVVVLAGSSDRSMPRPAGILATLQVDPSILRLACPVDSSQPFSSDEGGLSHAQAPGTGLVKTYPPQPYGESFTAGGGYWLPAFLEAQMRPFCAV